jgi:hypothetical protein
MMEIIVTASGVVRCVYGEEIDLATLGHVEIRRASRVEPDEHGNWWADLTPARGPKLGPFEYRRKALAAEMLWLRDHWLVV